MALSTRGETRKQFIEMMKARYQIAATRCSLSGKVILYLALNGEDSQDQDQRMAVSEEVHSQRETSRLRASAGNRLRVKLGLRVQNDGRLRRCSPSWTWSGKTLLLQQRIPSISCPRKRLIVALSKLTNGNKAHPVYKASTASP